MKLSRFEDPVLFQAVVSDYLLNHEAENNLPLGIMANLIAGEYQEQPPYMALVKDQGAPSLVLIRTPPFPVLFSFEPRVPEDELKELVIKDLLDTYGDELTGMTGNKELVSSFAESWQLTTGKQSTLKAAMRIYKAAQINPVSGVPGRMRPAGDEDQDLLKEWYSGFHHDASGDEPEPDQVSMQVERILRADSSQRGMMIWEVGRKPVSMTGFSGPTPNGIRIGTVYTPPALRRKGYASACVAATSQFLLDQGFKFCFLFTDLMNPTSNHIYQQVGYQPVEDVDSFEFK